MPTILKPIPARFTERNNHLKEIMLRYFITIQFLFFLSLQISFGQEAHVRGTIKNKLGETINDVSVKYKESGTTSDQSGFYSLKIPAEKDVEIFFSHVGYQNQTKILKLAANSIEQLDIVLADKVENLEEIEIISHKDEAEGITKVKVETIKNLPSANSGIESTIKTLALGASSDNELSTQYKVRGGNYDENLVYVNGIEVYRPFLVRSGQQEGLSFVNVDMTQNVKFSSGGFQAKYGDKLSSVLDITYKIPEAFALGSELSLLGGTLTAEGISKNKKSSGILGFRYRDNSLLVNSTEVISDYNPRFMDLQSFLSHRFSKKFSIDFLGNLSQNDYRYQPTTRVTKFGSLLDPKEVLINYDGQENTNYFTTFGALSANYQANTNLKFQTIFSLFNTQEEEFFDIGAVYNFGTPNTDAASEEYGETEYEEVGSQIDHARNILDALIGNVQIKGQYKKNHNYLDFGVKYQVENIKDRLVEWQVIDSAGFSLRPPGSGVYDQPYVSYEGPIIPYQSLHATQTTDMTRLMAFAQWNKKSYLNEHQIWTSLGLRAQQWTIEGNSQQIFSPRFQVALKPDWQREVLFRLSGGNYAQPPLYRELRDLNGDVVPGVKAQQSWHIVLGSDMDFQIWKRPFKLVTEAYYKFLTDVNPYTLDNVRIRYAAENNAVAYATGFDMRINGEFVPGTESWFSFSYLNTKENIDDQGYIPRPSDQRLKFGLLFQDYVPTMPQLKMFLNLVYNTGVPGGSPTYADPYDFQLRLNDYKRADIGVFYVFKDALNTQHPGKWLNGFDELSLGLELFNMFDINNSITNTWVRNIYDKRMYAVKNYMTGRVFNVKVKMKI